MLVGRDLTFDQVASHRIRPHRTETAGRNEHGLHDPALVYFQVCCLHNLTPFVHFALDECLE